MFERPRMVAFLRRPRGRPRTFPWPAREINQPSADGPTEAATISARGKPAPAQSPLLTWASKSTEPRRELEPRARDAASSPPALNSSNHGRMIVERLAVKLRAAVRGRSTASTACSTAAYSGAWTMPITPHYCLGPFFEWRGLFGTRYCIFAFSQFSPKDPSRGVRKFPSTRMERMET